MRRGAVVIALAVAACGDHYGTFLVADGRAGHVAFDHAEFFFGSSVDGAFASPHLGPSAGTVYARTSQDTDVGVPASHDGMQATYYLPSTKDNRQLGDYVLVVAYDANGAPVGVGDIADFPPPSATEVTEVPIALAPADGVELWGNRPGCVAWQRAPGDLVAVVRDNDRDCDTAPASTDCNDLAYCTPGNAACTAKPVVCADTCTLGCPGPNASCMPAVCLFSSVCDMMYCDTATNLVDKLTCLATIGPVTHADYQVPVVQTQVEPCVDRFDVKLPNNVACTNPRIEFSEHLPDGYTFEVDGGDQACTIQLIPSPTNQRFQGDHHLLVSIEAPDPANPRYSMFFGVMPLPVQQCTSVVTPSSNPLVINMCQ